MEQHFWLATGGYKLVCVELLNRFSALNPIRISAQGKDIGTRESLSQYKSKQEASKQQRGRNND